MDTVLDEIPTIRRKITSKDIQEIATLMSKRISETGAVLMLQIRPQSWFNWKSKEKNKRKFEELFTRIREKKLNSIIEAIDESGESREINLPNGKTYTKNGDWRAKAWIAERVLAPERFSDRQQAESTTPAQALADEVLLKIAAGMRASRTSKPTAQVIDIEPVKMIEQG